jgi:hypothetical protein
VLLALADWDPEPSFDEPTRHRRALPDIYTTINELAAGKASSLSIRAA